MEINQGRPITFIDVEVVKEHRRAGLNWIDVCNIFHVTKSTLLRWRQRNNFELN